MSEKKSNLQIRFYVDAARFFYEQMELNFQDITKFRRFLLAFVAIARSVTFVFKAEFHYKRPIMKWYNSKVEGWKSNKIMKFFIEMRNISLKMHAPEMEAHATILIPTRVLIRNHFSGELAQMEIPSHKPTKQSKAKEPDSSISSKVVSYSFLDLPKWFDENLDAIYLCKVYLDELEKFVTEVEKMIEKRGISHEH